MEVKIERKVVFDDDRISIIRNDCKAELGLLIANSIDVVVTSPPYNIGVDYNLYDDHKSPKEYLNWLGEIGKELYRVLKDDGSFFLNVGGTNKRPSIPMELHQVFVDQGFVLQNNIIWVKNIAIKDKSFGHFKPINSKRYLNNCHETLFHFTKNGEVSLDRLAIGVPYTDKTNIGRWKHAKSDLRCRGNVWYMPYKTVQASKEHPAGYPVELVENCLKLHGARPDLQVLDPFLGAGTTLVACANLGVRGIGIELDEWYCELARKRLIVVSQA